jgi:hypothetical protein
VESIARWVNETITGMYTIIRGTYKCWHIGAWLIRSYVSRPAFHRPVRHRGRG